MTSLPFKADNLETSDLQGRYRKRLLEVVL